MAQGRVFISNTKSKVNNHMAKLKEYVPKSDYAQKKIENVEVIKVEMTELDKRQLKSSASLFGVSSQRLAGMLVRDFLRSV